MLRQFKWPIWVVMLSLCLSLVFVTIKLSQLTQNITQTDKINLKVNNEEVSIHNGWNLKIETKEADNFTSTVSMIDTESETVNKPIRKWIAEQEKSFFKEMGQTEIILGSKFVAHFDVQPDVEKFNDSIYNVIIHATQHVDQLNEYKTANTFVINDTKRRS